MGLRDVLRESSAGGLVPLVEHIAAGREEEKSSIQALCIISCALHES